MTAWRLVADIGGTNARFARAGVNNSLNNCRTYNVSQFPSFIDALRAYLAETCGAEDCIGAAIGAAGPVAGGVAYLTNAPWTIEAAEISSHLRAPVTVVNDLEAAAFCLPTLIDSELRFFGEPAGVSASPIRLLAANVGTGFGAATLLRTEVDWVSCPSEAGHITFAPAGECESSFPPTITSVEHILSGSGLAELYRSIAQSAQSDTIRSLSAADILSRSKSDRFAVASVNIFTRILARVLGDLVLATAAWDGVFMFGSVAKGWAEAGDLQLFRRIFENKGAMAARMKHIPVALVLREGAALTGLAVMPLSPRRI